MNLYNYLQKPQVYEYGESIWTDEFISKQMLLAHLDTTSDAASYKSERMTQVQTYLYSKLGLKSGSRLIDLGCGPGLYTQWYARKGVSVTGMDISINSIIHSKAQAAKEDLHINYIVGDYRIPFGIDCYDAAMCIYEDYGVMSQKDRKIVLKNVYQALRTGGEFAIDVVADSLWDTYKEEGSWYSQESGFFRPHPHVVLNKRWLYPKERAYCHTHVVLDHKVTVYHTYQTLFTKERITKELKESGFEVKEILGGLEGSPFCEDSKQIGIIARKL